MTPVAAQPEQMSKGPWWRRWWAISLGVLVILSALSVAFGSGNGDPESAGDAPATTTQPAISVTSTTAATTTTATTTATATSTATHIPSSTTTTIVGPAPLWQRTHQDSWYLAASIHADNTPYGTPAWARETWDDIVLIDPSAPLEFRPFWVMKSGGEIALTEAFYDEIRERTAAGYRVIYTLQSEALTPADLRADVEAMAARDALPWGVGLWNELEFPGKLSPEEFSDRLTESGLPSMLSGLHDEFGVMISPPGLSSFANVILNGYGEIIRELFADRDGVFIKVHSYGHLQPKYWVEFDLREELRAAVGIPDAIVVIEEAANGFVGEHQPPHPGVGDEQGAEFMRAAMYAGMQTGMATAHFMLYHEWSNWNDISDPVEGALRRQVATDVLMHMRLTDDNDPPGALDLDDPLGRELDLSDFTGP